MASSSSHGDQYELPTISASSEHEYESIRNRGNSDIHTYSDIVAGESSPLKIIRRYRRIIAGLSILTTTVLICLIIVVVHFQYKVYKQDPEIESGLDNENTKQNTYNGNTGQNTSIRPEGTNSSNTKISKSETEFVIMFMRNLETSNLQIMISSLKPTDVEVFTAFDSSRQNYSITSGGILLNYSTSAVTGVNAIENKGIYIESKSKIYVNVINAYSGCCSDDGYSAIPIDFLGSEYAAVSTRYNGLPNQIGVVAADDNTVITFDLKVSQAVTYKGHTYNNGNKLQISLNKLQSFVLTYQQNDEYRTNMKVTGNKPFAAFSGNECGYVNATSGPCSYMVESVPPTTLYGQYYIVPQLSGLFYQTGFLKFTPLNNTDVAFEDYSNTLITLQTNSSSFESVDLSKPTVIPGKTKFLLTFYGRMKGTWVYSMINLPPLCRYSNSYTITTPSIRNYTNYISVAIETQYKSQLLLDNVALNNGISATFTLFGNSWSSLTLPIADGAHIVRHPDITVRFGVIQFGYFDRRSYGFPVHNDFLGPSIYCKQNSP